MHTVYALVVLYALCYQLQAPLEPYLVETLVRDDQDASAAYARLQSFFSLVQLVGSCAVGYMLDVAGLRGMFALNFVACAAVYALLASATSIEMLFASKIPGMFQAGFLCAQVAAAKLTSPGAERATALGRLTSAYTVGGTLGPALGGAIGTQAASRLAVAGSLLALALVLTLPLDAADARADAQKRAKPRATEEGAAAEAWTRRVVLIVSATWPLLLTKALAGLTNSAAAAVRPLVLKGTFGFSQSRLGVFMSTAFFANALVGLQLGAITARMGGAMGAIVACLRQMCMLYAVMACAFEPTFALGTRTIGRGAPIFIGLALALSIFQFPLATTLTAQSTASVPPRLKGTLVGIEHALFALAGMGGPAVGELLLRTAGLAGFAAAAAAAYALVYLTWKARFVAWIVREVGAAAGAAVCGGKETPRAKDKAAADEKKVLEARGRRRSPRPLRSRSPRRE